MSTLQLSRIPPRLPWKHGRDFLSPILLFGLDKQVKTAGREAALLCMHASLSHVARYPQSEGSFWSGFSVHMLKALIKFAQTFFSVV